jgi:hypothetical protein
MTIFNFFPPPLPHFLSLPLQAAAKNDAQRIIRYEATKLKDAVHRMYNEFEGNVKREAARNLNLESVVESPPPTAVLQSTMMNDLNLGSLEPIPFNKSTSSAMGLPHTTSTAMKSTVSSSGPLQPSLKNVLNQEFPKVLKTAIKKVMEQLRKITTILPPAEGKKQVRKDNTFYWFFAPVKAEQFPQYYNVITHPMDFDTIQKKNLEGLYKTVDQFVKDIELIVNNCLKFNPDIPMNKLVRDRAHELWDIFNANKDPNVVVPKSYELKEGDKVGLEYLHYLINRENSKIEQRLEAKNNAHAQATGGGGDDFEDFGTLFMDSPERNPGNRGYEYQMDAASVGSGARYPASVPSLKRKVIL